MNITLWEYLTLLHSKVEQCKKLWEERKFSAACILAVNIEKARSLAKQGYFCKAYELLCQPYDTTKKEPQG